jgi:aspartate/tyrosine/aromatic aminotransferase
MGFFEHLDLLAPDPILGLTAAFKADPRKEKIDLSVGIYRNEALEVVKMTAVDAAERELLEHEKNKTYLPIDGDPLFIREMNVLVFGDDLSSEERSRIAGVQALGGTGGLSLALDFLGTFFSKKIFISDPTWANHLQIARYASCELFRYPYYDQRQKKIDFESCFEALEKAPEKSVILFHGCCHNPTGVDFNLEQWKRLCELCKNRRFFPLFDLAYQGFGESLEKDVEAIRLFFSEGNEFAVAQSCSKNFGLYGERVGSLFFVSSSFKESAHLLSHLKPFIRTNYSNPPRHGALLVGMILADRNKRELWEKELGMMRHRINKSRQKFTKALSERLPEKDFSYLDERKGMFSFVGLNERAVERLLHDHAIYMTRDGRINICGLNNANMGIVADAFCQVLA